MDKEHANAVARAPFSLTRHRLAIEMVLRIPQEGKPHTRIEN